MNNAVSCVPVAMTSSKSVRWLCASISKPDGEWLVNVLPGLYEYQEEAWAVAVANDCHVLGVKIEDGVGVGFVELLSNPSAKFSPDLIILYGLGSLSFEVHRCLKFLKSEGAL